MKLFYFIQFTFIFYCSSSFGAVQDCDYANSNIGYVKNQTKKALSMKDLQMARFYTFKALNALEKSRLKIEDCGCEYALDSALENIEYLKNATKATSIAGTRILLNKALQYSKESLEAITNHDEHGSIYGSNNLVMNVASPEPEHTMAFLDNAKIQEKIDTSLLKYKNSLDKVINTVDCVEAKAFAQNIYENCEQELLKPHLSESKKYYNLKTKQITAKALERLKNCQN
ncbi:hypothetical protein [Zobellia alginiliquefaciens]|uniref:hypothetical protein n=1 Tax=Zobellia alginiliquefaciens TaxID=3032586 RepID=UPI0023E46728|nr:hypothetical protein [Zobellia alginiliquefaciens]